MRHVAYRILIVDDSEPFRRTAAQLLVKRGFESAGAVADGEAALISSVCPAVIVLTSSDIDEVPTVALEACGASAFVPKVELAMADLEGLFANGRSGPGQD